MQVAKKSDPDIIFLAQEDWANVAFNFEKAAKAVGINAKALTKKPHAYYDEQARVYYRPEIELYPLCMKAKWIVWMHSQFTPLPDQILNDRGIKFAVFHGGTAYRTQSEQLNRIFNPRVDLTLIQTLEMWDLGAKEPKYQLIPPVDTDLLEPDYTPLGSRPVVAHHPRHPEVKGSAEIVKGVEEMLDDTFTWNYDATTVAWGTNLNRLRACDVYIEQLGTGYWSVTALEAAALGKVVLASFDHEDLYEKNYGCSIPGVQRIDDRENMKEVLRRVLDGDIDDFKREARKWVEEYHSYVATGNRIKDIFKL